jgi:alkylation response protein AidB-like acyl-CoA dehydrogenase
MVVAHLSNIDTASVLTDAVLQRARERATGYDAHNKFFSEDLSDLRELGYLKPRPLSHMIRDQRLLASYAPATALGIGMHLTWMGVARDMVADGHQEMQWVLDDGEAGELFAFGVSEKGNDHVLTDSLTRVEEVDGGFAFYGTKIFVSLSPAWTRLSLLGRLGDEIVHGFISREQQGWSNTPDWDMLGMRATQSYTTVLDGVVVAPDRVARRLPAGPNDDPFIVAIFQNFLLLVSSVYAGIADRALQLAVEAAQKKTSGFDQDYRASADPDLRWRIADAAISLDALRPQLETYARYVDKKTGVHPHWFRLLSGVKHSSVETARRVVDQAMRVAGGSGYRVANELSRLQRDVLAGIYHPSDTEAVHRTVAFDLLGPLT